MDRTLTYTNHLGESLTLGPESIYHYGKHTFYDASRSYEIENGRASSLRREPREHELPIMVETASEDEGPAARERLRSVLSADLLAEANGTVTIGGWELRAKPVRIERDAWWYCDRYAETRVTLLAERPVWTRATTYAFVPDRSPGVQGTQLDYPYDHPYDHTPNAPIRQIDVRAEGLCAWRLVVYGPATDPYVVIGGNRYQVTTSVPEGGVLIADSRDPSIIVRDVDGNQTDAFAGRIHGRQGSGEYMWEPIKPGISAVSWSNAFGFDITVYEERDEAPCI